MNQRSVEDRATAAKRFIPRSIDALLRECSGMPLDKALSLLRLRLWRRLGLRSDRRILRRVKPESVLFVCHANIIRSPMAAELFRSRMAALDKAIGVASAGTWTTAGRPSDTRAVAAASALGVSLESHRSRSLTAGLVAHTDLICVMDYRNEVDIITRFPRAARKTILLGSLDALNPGDRVIPDPLGLGDAGFATCYQRLARAVDSLVREIAER